MSYPLNIGTPYMDSSDDTAQMHLFTSFSMLHIANSAVQVEMPDNMAFNQGLQYLKYQFMMTQTEGECDKSRRTGDYKCVPISKARSGSRIS